MNLGVIVEGFWERVFNTVWEDRSRFFTGFVQLLFRYYCIYKGVEPPVTGYYIQGP